LNASFSLTSTFFASRMNLISRLHRHHRSWHQLVPTLDAAWTLDAPGAGDGA
jgi:hypothetical protein